MTPLTAVVTAALLAGASPDSTYAVVRTAVRAVEGDSIVRVASRWEARVRTAPDDRMAMLGLGHLAQLQYRYEESERRGRRVSTGRRDALAVRGTMLVAASFAMRARYRDADSALMAAMRLADELKDDALGGEVRVAAATTRIRTAGLSAGDTLLADAARLLPPDDVRRQAGLRCARALVLATRGRAEARAEALAAADLAQRAGERRLQASCLMVVAQDLMRTGRGDSAGAVYGTVLSLQRAARDRAGTAITLQWRGFLATSVGAYGAALRDLREAVREGTAVRAPTPVAWASLSLASIARDFGDLEEASSNATRARESFVASGDQLGAAGALAVMGDMARASGDVSRARALYDEALAAARRDGRSSTAAALFRGLADLSMMRGRWGQAAQELDSARRLARSAGLAQNGTQELLLALRRGALDEADRLRREMTGAVEQRGRAYTSRVLTAELHARRGAPDSARAYLTLALDEIDRWRASLDDRQLRLAVFEPRVLYADPDLGFATIIAALARAGQAPAAFELAERRRARELLDRLVQGEAAGERATDIGATVTSRDGIRSRSRFFYERSLTSDELQRALPDDRTAVLEYVTGRGGEPTTLFAITRSSLTVHELATIDTLAPMVQRFVRYAESGVAAPALAASLGEALVGPVVRALPASVTHLVIVADDGLHRLPFDALALPAVPALVERFVVSTSPSAAVARALWQRGNRGQVGEVLALGDPTFPRLPQPDLAPGAGVTRGRTLPPLPYTREEVRRVAQLVAPAEVRLASEASEAWLKRTSLERFGIVHLATHAWVDDRSLRRTAVALSAGAGEDGFMLPTDFAALSLDSDVFVLSACGTAGGVERRGEGVLGLTAPLLAAGSRSVVATGWRVGDRAAARMVGDLYAALATGASVGEALRTAKRSARARGAPLSEWAAFSVVGNGSVRPRQAPTEATAR